MPRARCPPNPGRDSGVEVRLRTRSMNRAKLIGNHEMSDKPHGSNRDAGRYDDCDLAPRHGIAAVFVRDLSNEITAEPGFQIDVLNL